jgi:hypothetical protein
MKKITFEFFNEILERDEVETMQAKAMDEQKGTFQLAEIPFFVKGFALEDIVLAVEEKGLLKVKELVQESGNSTINVILLKGRNKGRILHELSGLGCTWKGMEQVVPGYYAVNVPGDAGYKPVLQFLKTERKEGILDFREACLRHSSQRSKAVN